MNAAIRQDDFQIVSDVEQLKLLAHGDRLRILGELRGEALTGSMVAERLGIPANRAHYHLRLLFDGGFVQLERTGRRRWNEERFYLATARQYLVDPSLTCDDPATLNTLRNTVEECFERWRRHEVLAIGLEEVAVRIIRDGLRILPGEHVMITVNPATLELAEVLSIELEAIGAHSYLKPWSKAGVLRTIERHDRDSLARLPFIDPEIDERLAACIHLSSTAPQPFDPTPEQKSLLPLRLEALSRWQQSLIDRGVRYIEISLPHRAELGGLPTSPEEGLDTFWRSFEASPEELSERAGAILGIVRDHPRLVLERDEGGDTTERLALEVDPRHTRICDGRISDEDRAEGRCVDNFPTGGISFLPLRGTASGTLRADYTFVQGEHIRDIRLTIESGRLVEIGAGENTELLNECFDRAVGEPRTLSEVAFGLNPAGRRLTGKATLDSCLEGVVTLTFGNNELLGGDVHSTVTVNLPCAGLTVRAGDRLILEGGRPSPGSRDA